MKTRFDPASIAAQGGQTKRADGAVVPPIQPSTTFARDDDYALKGGHLYARYGEPTGAELEALICDLEGASGALAFASGMAAIACVLEAVPVGGSVLVPKVMYFAAQAWMSKLAETGRFSLSIYDNGDANGLKSAASGREFSLIWVETPANPEWHVTDIAEAAELARSCGATLAVDSTCAPPCTTKTLSLGADIVMHSATKYLNGHSDVMAGVLAFKDPKARDIHEPIRRLMGAHLGAFESWLLIRGLRTLWVRFERQSETALTLARWLEDHPNVERIAYPGLPAHPQHAIAMAQMTGGFGGMLSIWVRGGYEAAKTVATSTRLFIPATSLGSVESLIEHRKAVEGPTSAVADNLIRLSVGIEDIKDLWDDLDQALGRIG
jgi:cystathionine gamma-synthase